MIRDTMTTAVWNSTPGDSQRPFAPDHCLGSPWKLRDGIAVWFDNYVDPASPLRALEREGAS